MTDKAVIYDRENGTITKNGQVMTTKEIVEDLAVGALAVVMLKSCSIEREELKKQIERVARIENTTV